MAKKVKPQEMSKEQAVKLLSKVPEEHAFWCHDGSIFRDIKELAEGLVTMSDEVFAYHANPEKNDFSNWVRDVIKDEKLARDLMNSSDREQAAKRVAERVDYLKTKLAEPGEQRRHLQVRRR